MALRFSTFRQLLCILLALTASISVLMDAFLTRAFFRRGFGWLLVIIDSFSAMRAGWSIIRKPIFNTPQPVASEAIGLFVLFPFHLIIILVIASPSTNQDVNDHFEILKIFTITTAVLLYAGGLMTVAALTVTTYDGDVWLRDIDSTPSPFPMPIIFASLCPCLARRFASTRSLIPQHVPLEPTPPPPCLPGCNCQENGCSRPKSSEIQASSLAQCSEGDARPRPPVLPHTLVRIPNAAERRASIVLELPIQGQFV